MNHIARERYWMNQREIVDEPQSQREILDEPQSQRERYWMNHRARER